MRKILGIVFVFVFIFSFGISSSVFGDINTIKKVSFYGSDNLSYFLGDKPRIIPLFTEDNNGIPFKKYYIQILEGKELLEVIKTKGFRDVLKLKRIIDEKYIGYNNVSLRITTDDDKEGYIYDRGTISIIKPIILVSGKLGPDGGQITNNWKDIQINIDKGKLDKNYNINYLGGLSENGSINFAFEIIPEMSDKLFNKLNFIEPSYDLIKNNYLRVCYKGECSKNINYYTFKNNKKVDFRKIINEQKIIEDKINVIQNKTQKAWDYYGIAYKNAGKNPDFNVIDLNLKKAKKLISEINNSLSKYEIERYTKKISYKINEFEEKIEKYKKNFKYGKNTNKLKIESKVLFFKNLILSKKALEKTSKGDIYKGLVDKRVYILDDKKLVVFHNLLGKIDLNNNKYKKYKLVLEYMKAKIGMEIWNRESIDKEEN